MKESEKYRHLFDTLLSIEILLLTNSIYIKNYVDKIDCNLVLLL